MSSTDLYRFFDAAGDLLYVGISVSAIQRASEHRADKGWWHEVASMTVEKVPGDRAAALEAERLAILNEGPRYNVVHNQGGAPNQRRMATTDAPLVGKWVHTYKGDAIEYQGQIVSAVGDLFLVEFYDFVIGEAWGSRLVSVYDMTTWVLYDDEASMVYEYEQYDRRRSYRDRQERLAQLGDAPSGEAHEWTPEQVYAWRDQLKLCIHMGDVTRERADHLWNVVVDAYNAAQVTA